MSGDLMRLFEKDQTLAEQLASTPGNSLGQICARQFVKARRIEVERQNRRDCAAEQWKAYEDAQHRRAIEAARAPAPPAEPLATVAEVQTALMEIGRVLGGELSAMEKRLAASQHLDGDPWNLRTKYQPGAIVKYRGYSWRCICAGSGLAPDRRPNHWEPYGAAPPVGTNLADPDLAALEQRLAALESKPPGAAAPSPELAPLHVSFNKDRRR